MKILLAVDGSDYTKRMLEYMESHEALFGPAHEYTLFTVVAHVPAHAARFLDRGVLDEYYREQADAVLTPLKGFIDRPGWKVQATHVVGHIAEAIAHFATEQKHDLIVMGAHGHSVLARSVLGSVSAGVLSRCTVPVLLIR